MQKHKIPLTRQQQLSSFAWAAFSLLFGWTLFGYWWARVLVEDQPRPLITLVLLVALFCCFVLLGTLVWIWHNRRLARRGSRGMAARYSVPVFARDALGREVSIPADSQVRDASVVIVSTSAAGKLYTADSNAG